MKDAWASGIGFGQNRIHNVEKLGLAIEMQTKRRKRAVEIGVVGSYSNSGHCGTHLPLMNHRLASSYPEHIH